MADEPRPAGIQAPTALGTAPGHPLPAGAGAEGTLEWSKRPAFHPEEGEADRSDWLAFAKSLALIMGVLAVIAFLLSR